MQAAMATSRGIYQRGAAYPYGESSTAQGLCVLSTASDSRLTSSSQNLKSNSLTLPRTKMMASRLRDLVAQPRGDQIYGGLGAIMRRWILVSRAPNESPSQG